MIVFQPGQRLSWLWVGCGSLLSYALVHFGCLPQTHRGFSFRNISFLSFRLTDLFCLHTEHMGNPTIRTYLLINRLDYAPLLSKTTQAAITETICFFHCTLHKCQVGKSELSVLDCLSELITVN